MRGASQIITNYRHQYILSLKEAFLIDKSLKNKRVTLLKPFKIVKIKQRDKLKTYLIFIRAGSCTILNKYGGSRQ